jgi:hypothetical protein
MFFLSCHESILEEVLQSLEAGRFNIPLLEEVNPDVAEVIQNLIEQNSVFTFELREVTKQLCCMFLLLKCSNITT